MHLSMHLQFLYTVHFKIIGFLKIFVCLLGSPAIQQQYLQLIEDWCKKEEEERWARSTCDITRH